MDSLMLALAFGIFILYRCRSTPWAMPLKIEIQYNATHMRLNSRYDSDFILHLIWLDKRLMFTTIIRSGRFSSKFMHINSIRATICWHLYFALLSFNAIGIPDTMVYMYKGKKCMEEPTDLRTHSIPNKFTAICNSNIPVRVTILWTDKKKTSIGI